MKRLLLHLALIAAGVALGACAPICVLPHSHCPRSCDDDIAWRTVCDPCDGACCRGHGVHPCERGRPRVPQGSRYRTDGALHWRTVRAR